MKLFYSLFFLLLPALSFSDHGLHKDMLVLCDTVSESLRVSYAPKEWKEKLFHFDFEKELEKLRKDIESQPEISLKDFQARMQQFFFLLQDYHCTIRFHKTERASLPFDVQASDERKYYVCHIDRKKLGEENSPLEIGDELLSFDGRPIDEIVQELKAKLNENVAPSAYENNPTEQAFAQSYLTRRHASRNVSLSIPQGSVDLSFAKKEGKILQLELPWEYFEESIPSTFVTKSPEKAA